MGINLTKGERAELTKGTGIQKLKICLGWDVQQFEGKQFDLDGSALLLNAQGKLANDGDLVFYNNLSHSSGSVIHSGDNLTGAGEGDDEIIRADLTKVPTTVERIAIVVTIHEAIERRQNFGMISNAFVRIVDETIDKEILKYELGEDFSTETSVVIGEIYRHSGEWKFNAVGAGYVGDIATIIKNYR